MDLTTRLRHVAFRRPRLLVVAAPTAVATRLAVERYARERGWPMADSAADADVLAVLGSHDDLAGVVSVLESQIPAPWARVDLNEPQQVHAALAAVPVQLAEWRAASSPARGAITDQGASAGNEHAPHAAPAAESPESDRRQPDHKATSGHETHGESDNTAHANADHAGHGPAATGGHEPSRHAGHGSEHGMGRAGEGMAHHASEGGDGMAGHGGDGMAGHGGHDMGAHGGHHDHAGPVAGLRMASRAPDRDGLKLDVLHVPLGPVLPYWPAGLRLLLTVQGDVVQDVAIERLGVPDHAGPSFWDEPALRVLAGEKVENGELARRRASAYLDSLVRLLGVAGWDAAASRSAVLRDRLLAGEATGQLSRDVDRFGRRVLASRTLHRMTAGLGVLDEAAAKRLGTGGPASATTGDVWARMAHWVRATGEDVARAGDKSLADDVGGPRGRLDAQEPPSAALLAVLPSLVLREELAGVRLIVASLDPDLAELAHAGEVSAGA